MRIIALGVGLAVAALAAQDTEHHIGNGISPPSISYKVEPRYSDVARQAHLEGTVLLSIVIDADGNPRDFNVLRGLGLGLDEEAIAAVSKWHFQPGLKSGQPVNVQAQVQVNFRLLPDRDQKGPGWHLARVEFHILEGSLRPIIEKVAIPRVANDALDATATMTFDIDEKGEPVNIRTDKSSDEEWAHDVASALKKWKFAPAGKDSPVSVSCTMDFVRGN